MDAGLFDGVTLLRNNRARFRSIVTSQNLELAAQSCPLQDVEERLYGGHFDDYERQASRAFSRSHAERGIEKSKCRS